MIRMASTKRTMRAGLLVLAGLLPAACVTYPPQPAVTDGPYMMQTLQSALEYNRTGDASHWRNPANGNTGSVTPTRTFEASAGQPCRNFEETLTGRRATGYRTGTGCRTNEGFWEIVEVTAFVRYVQPHTAYYEPYPYPHPWLTLSYHFGYSSYSYSYGGHGYRRHYLSPGHSHGWNPRWPPGGGNGKPWAGGNGKPWAGGNGGGKPWAGGNGGGKPWAGGNGGGAPWASGNGNGGGNGKPWAGGNGGGNGNSGGVPWAGGNSGGNGNSGGSGKPWVGGGGKPSGGGNGKPWVNENGKS